LRIGAKSTVECGSFATSSASASRLRGIGPSSLNPNPARSYEHTVANFAISGCTLCHVNESLTAPASSITVDVPLPAQRRLILRPPMSTNLAGLA